MQLLSQVQLLSRRMHIKTVKLRQPRHLVKQQQQQMQKAMWQ